MKKQSLVEKLKEKLLHPAAFRFSILLLIIVIAGLLIYYLKVPLEPNQFKEWILAQEHQTIALFLINWLVVFYPFFPNQIIHMAAGWIFPFWKALLIIHLCSIFAWCVNYLLGRKLGRNFVEHVMGFDAIDRLDKKLQNAKWWHFLILSITPGFSYDVIGYVAGSLKAPFLPFFIGAIFGTLPALTITLLIGNKTNEIPWLGPFIILVGIVSSIVVSYWTYKKNK